MSDDDKPKEPLNDEAEGLRARLSEIEDGRDRKEHDFARLKKSLVFLRRILNTIPTPVYVKDRNGYYFFCNTSFEEFIGLKKDEIIGKTDHDMNPERIADPYHEMDNVLVESGGTQEYEVYFRNPAGNSRAMLFSKACLLDTDGVVSGLVGVITDITDRKVVEEEKKELISRLHSALAEIKTLSGMLPICSYCKKVRDDKGYWLQIERYVQEHSEAQFSHGICPDCLKRHYPERNVEKKRE